MTRILTTLLASTTLLGAGSAMAATSGEAPKSICANAFTTANINIESGLSQAQIEAIRDTEFSDLDANDDGKISRAEFTDCMGKAEKAAQEQAAEGQESGKFEVGKWSDLELEINDKLSAEEWADLAEQAWETSPADAQKVFTYNDWIETEEHYAQAAINRFKQQDQDGDGVLTKNEYETLAREIKFDEEALDQRFDAMDVDETGAISPQEYRAAGTWMAEPAALNTETEREHAKQASVKRFQRNDIDGDGSLSMKEFAKSERGGNWSGEELKARFETLDVDDTGGISPQEYRPAATWMPGAGAMNVDDAASDASAGRAEGEELVPVYYYFIEIM